jgi:hypothetical protein
MSEDSRHDQITVRVIRNGLPEPPDNDWSMVSPEERIEAVWMLTELCLAWHKPSESVPRLQRTVTRLQRHSGDLAKGRPGAGACSYLFDFS